MIVVSEIKRKRSESFESFMRRVKKRWQSSGKLLQARKVQYFNEEKSKNLQKVKRVELLQKVSKINYLRKVGRLPAEDETTTRYKR